MTSSRTRRVLRAAGIGCAIVLLGVLGIIGWVVLQVRAMDRPVVVLIGENEVIYSISGAEAIAKVNRVAPEIETELFTGCGHDITLVQAERFNRRVLEFLEPEM